MNFDPLFTYFQQNSFVTIFVISWLSLYFILTFTIFISRMVGLGSWISKEKRSLEEFLIGKKFEFINSSFKKFLTGKICKEKLKICIKSCEQNATSGLSWLSIIASTSPFIGLFGTVVSILDTFSKMGEGNSSINSIAPAISEALVATGAGIFVAIPAYTFHLILKRKIYELMLILDQEKDVILLENENV